MTKTTVTAPSSPATSKGKKATKTKPAKKVTTDPKTTTTEVVPKKTTAKNEEKAEPETNTAKVSKPTYLNLIIEAIKNLNESRGSSRQAIFKYIISTHDLNSKQVHIRGNLAIKTAMTNGTLQHGKS